VLAAFLTAGVFLAPDALDFFLGVSSLSDAEPDSSPEKSSSLSSNSSSSSLSLSGFQSPLAPDVFLFLLDSSSSDESA